MNKPGQAQFLEEACSLSIWLEDNCKMALKLQMIKGRVLGVGQHLAHTPFPLPLVLVAGGVGTLRLCAGASSPPALPFPGECAFRKTAE